MATRPKPATLYDFTHQGFFIVQPEITYIGLIAPLTESSAVAGNLPKGSTQTKTMGIIENPWENSVPGTEFPLIF